MTRGLIATLVFVAAAGCAGGNTDEFAALDPENRRAESDASWRHAASKSGESGRPTHDHIDDAETHVAAIRKAAARTTADPQFADAVAQGGEVVVVDVEGMSCIACAAAMNRTFDEKGAVAASAADLDRRSFAIVLKPGETLDDAAIRRLVTEAGFSAADIRRGDAASAAIASAPAILPAAETTRQP